MHRKIFVVAEGTADQRQRKLEQVKAYLWDGWKYQGWGPLNSSSTVFHGKRGFFFEGPEEAGWTAQALVDRLATGLHFGEVIS